MTIPVALFVAVSTALTPVHALNSVHAPNAVPGSVEAGPRGGVGPFARSHELERTQVVVTFSADGAFQIDILNDADWLLARLEPFSGMQLSGRLDPRPRDRRLAELEATFAERISLYFDDVRTEVAVEYVPPSSGPVHPNQPPLGRMRLRGTVPEGTTTFQWSYGLVIDPYPMMIADPYGAWITHWVPGDMEGRPGSGASGPRRRARRTPSSRSRGKGVQDAWGPHARRVRS